MSVKLLEQIRAAEQAAEQLRQQAQRDAREMIKASEEASAHARREADLTARAHYREEMARAQQDIQATLNAAGIALEQARQDTLKQARARIPDAARLIAERILR